MKTPNKLADSIIGWTCAAMLFGLLMYDLGRMDEREDLARGTVMARVR